MMSRRLKMYQERRDRFEQGPWGKRTGWGGVVLENQPLCPPPQLHSEMAEDGVSDHWKELEGVPVNRVYLLCEVTAKVICWQWVQGVQGRVWRREWRLWKATVRKGEGASWEMEKTELLWGDCFYLPLLTAITHFRDVFSTRIQTKENTIFQHKTWNVAKSSTFHKTEDL